MASIEEDIPTFLNGKTAGALALVAGSNVFAGHPDDDDDADLPDNAVFCRVEGGGPVVPYFGGAVADDFGEAILAVYVRYQANKRGEGRTAAQAINKLLHKGAIAGYTYILALQTDPGELEKDGKERHTWKMLFRVARREAL